MKSLGRMSLMAAAVLANAGLAMPAIHTTPNLVPKNKKRKHTRIVGRVVPTLDDPKINRWTGLPHEHKREIARRTRQAARKGASV